MGKTFWILQKNRVVRISFIPVLASCDKNRTKLKEDEDGEKANIRRKEQITADFNKSCFSTVEWKPD